jgi:hypothetical protein
MIVSDSGRKRLLDLNRRFSDSTIEGKNLQRQKSGGLWPHEKGRMPGGRFPQRMVK